MSLLTKKEREEQQRVAELLAASRRKAEIERKNRHVIKAGNQPSQWGRVVQNESRLIDNGHYMRSSQQLEVDRLEREIRRAKSRKSGKNVQKWTHVKKEGGTTIEVVDKTLEKV